MKRVGLLIWLILGMLTLSCSLGADLPFIGSTDGEISPEDVAAAATRAAEVADQAGQLAATAVIEGDQVVSTAIAEGGEIAATAILAPEEALSSLELKLINIQPDANGNFVVVITEDDLNQFISGQEGGGFQGNEFGITDVQITILADVIELSGTLVDPIQAPLNVQLRPVVTGGKLEFQILTATLGGFPMPASITDLLSAAVNNELTRALLGLPANVTLQEAIISEGLLTIMGHQG